MSDYKIKVNNEVESKEAQELFFELGYGWHGCGKEIYHLNEIWETFTHLVARQIGSYKKLIIQMGCGKEDCKEITLPQLRDLVVLKRNDVNDKNAEDGTFHDLYKTSDGVIYFYHHPKQEWTRSHINERPEYLHLVKPISEKQMTSHNIEQQAFNGINFSDEHMLKIKPRPYLDPTQNYAEIEWDGTTLKSDDWIEVPDGAEVATKGVGKVCFWKNKDQNFFFNSKGEWSNNCGETLKQYLAKQRGKVKVIWQRTQDEPFLTPESVVEREVNHKNVVEKTNEFNERLKMVEREVKRLAEIEVTKIANCVPPLSSIAGTIKPKLDLSPQNEFTLSNEQQQLLIEYPHYYKDVRHLAVVDVYEVLDLFNVTDQTVGHAVKKLLVTGKRGAKGRLQDLIEARDTLSRAIEIQERKNEVE